MPTVDHVVPVCAGGPDTLDNKQVLCSSCNRAKSDSLDSAWDFRLEARCAA